MKKSACVRQGSHFQFDLHLNSSINEFPRLFSHEKGVGHLFWLPTLQRGNDLHRRMFDFGHIETVTHCVTQQMLAKDDKDKLKYKTAAIY